MLSVRADFKHALRAARDIPRRQVRKLATAAINKSIRKVRTRSSRTIARTMGMKRTRVLGEMDTKFANGSRMFASITTQGRPVPLIHFNNSRAVGAGAKSGAYGVNRTYRGAFVARMKSGHVGIFTRARVSPSPDSKKVARLKIRELSGPSIPRTMLSDVVMREMDSTAKVEFLREFRRLLQVQNRLSRARRVLP